MTLKGPNSEHLAAREQPQDADDRVVRAGSYGSPSPYGTYDQAGNVWEWNEAIISGSSRGLRGGSFDGPFGLAAAERFSVGATNEGYNVGFRLVMILEPSTALLVFAGLLGIAGWRRALA